MNIDTAISGVLSERDALQQPEGISSPSYISIHMQTLSQYTAALEECVGDEKKRLEVEESQLFKEYREKGESVNAAQTLIKYSQMTDYAELNRLQRLCSSSWRFISVAQSRHKHLMAEALNQV